MAVVKEGGEHLNLPTIVEEGTKSSPRYFLGGFEDQTKTKVASVKDFVTSGFPIDKGTEASPSGKWWIH